MLSVSKAQERLLDGLQPVGVSVVPLTEVNGRILARPISALTDSPSFTNSAMDGFAVLSEDVILASEGAPVVLEVVGDVPAGKALSIEVKPGQAVRIMTGAPIPAGVDAVVPVEQTDFNFRDPTVKLPEKVKIFAPSVRGQHLRIQGEDFLRGEVILPAGHKIRPQDMGMLAMMGYADVQVYLKPRIALLSSGDELLPVEAQLEPGKIRDTNSYTLQALLEANGAEVVPLGIARDTIEDVQEKLNAAYQQNVDMIVASAGVSVGVFDYVRHVVEKYGRLDFWRVNMRPGKPLVYGSYRDLPFVGLPGNPVSSYIGFEVFLKPALARLAGHMCWRRQTFKVLLKDSIESDGRESYLRVSIEFEDDQLVARLTGHQGSGNLYSLVKASGLIVIPAEVTSVAADTEVEAWTLD
jgi:molybdopterin molybdotransferase